MARTRVSKRNNGDDERPASTDYNAFIRSNFKNFQEHFKLRLSAAVFHELGKAWNQLGQTERMIYRNHILPRSRIPAKCSAHTLLLDSRKIERKSTGNIKVEKDEVNDDTPEIKRKSDIRDQTGPVLPLRRRAVHTPSQVVTDVFDHPMKEEPHTSTPDETDDENSQSVERTEIFTERFIELSREREKVRRALKVELAAARQRRDRIQTFLSNTLAVQPELKRHIAVSRVWIDKVEEWHKKMERKLRTLLRRRQIPSLDESSIQEMGFVRLVEYLADNQQNIPGLRKIFIDLMTCAKHIV